jgi:hypothetical protein
MDKAEFKFPHEAEDEKVDDPRDEGIDLEIEIEDDTPLEDRNKESFSEETKKELYEDELEDYSTKVKNKIKQMKKLAHDERREKEAVERREQEAINLAKKIVEENKRLKATLQDSEKNVLASIQKAVDMEMENAKREYREAYESGDADRVVEAQSKLTEASMRMDKVKNYRPAPLQEDEVEVQTEKQIPQQTIKADPTAVEWQARNRWFGDDKLMTSLALGLHEQLKEEGVAVSSKEYYRRIDDTMRKRFPEKFESDTDKNDDTPVRSTKPSSVVAPATRSTSPKKIRLNQSQLAISRRLGLTPEQYAQAVLKMEAANG